MEHTGQPTVILAHTIKGYILDRISADATRLPDEELTLEDATAA